MPAGCSDSESILSLVYVACTNLEWRARRVKASSGSANECVERRASSAIAMAIYWACVLAMIEWSNMLWSNVSVAFSK